MDLINAGPINGAAVVQRLKYKNINIKIKELKLKR